MVTEHDRLSFVNSTANPWLDFLPASQAQTLATKLNEDLEQYCATAPNVPDNPHDIKRLYGFGLLPLVPQVTTSVLLQIVHQIAGLPHLRGLIMGTRGIGRGLDDESLDPVWAAIEKAGLVVFIHPHYGVDGSAWGEKDNGHVLPLALGFPFETTTVRSPPFLWHMIATVYLTITGRSAPYPVGHLRQIP